jgi:carbamoyl-phosphate synthase large subunit
VPRRADLRKILIVGSGPIVIGQACEFGSCCCHAAFALREGPLEVLSLQEIYEAP